MAIEDKKWVKEHIESLEEDVEDNQKALDQSFKELEDAQKWLEKAKLNYAESIIRLDKFKKEHNIK